MAAFAGENMVMRAVPVHAGFAKASTGGNHGLIANGNALDLIESDNILSLKQPMPQALASRSLMRTAVLDLQFVGEAMDSTIQGRFEASTRPVADGAGDTEARRCWMHDLKCHKLRDDLIQAGILTAGKNGSRDETEMAILEIEERQPGVGASDIACQNHFSKFLQWRPSRSSNSSASLGPQVPAA